MNNGQIRNEIYQKVHKLGIDSKKNHDQIKNLVSKNLFDEFLVIIPNASEKDKEELKELFNLHKKQQGVLPDKNVKPKPVVKKIQPVKVKTKVKTIEPNQKFVGEAWGGKCYESEHEGRIIRTWRAN